MPISMKTLPIRIRAPYRQLYSQPRQGKWYSAERLTRTIKEEKVDLSEYFDYNDAYRQLGRFLDQVYMHKRIHSSLDYLI